MILDRALAAARQASNNNRREPLCETCKPSPYHLNQPTWHGLVCAACGCRGAWGDVAEAWLPVKATDDDQQEAS